MNPPASCPSSAEGTQETVVAADFIFLQELSAEYLFLIVSDGLQNGCFKMHPQKRKKDHVC